MNTKHTQGPWFVDATRQEGLAIRADSKTVCQIPGYGVGTRVDDARLIAAAPELLEALILAWPIIEHERFKQDGSYGSNFVQHKADRARQAHAKARAAIAKANGEQV